MVPLLLCNVVIIIDVCLSGRINGVGAAPIGFNENKSWSINVRVLNLWVLMISYHTLIDVNSWYIL